MCCTIGILCSKQKIALIAEFAGDDDRLYTPPATVVAIAAVIVAVAIASRRPPPPPPAIPHHNSLTRCARLDFHSSQRARARALWCASGSIRWLPAGSGSFRFYARLHTTCSVQAAARRPLARAHYSASTATTAARLVGRHSLGVLWLPSARSPSSSSLSVGLQRRARR